MEQLTINGQTADIGKGGIPIERLAYNYEEGVASRGGDKSIQVTLPRTQANDQIFKGVAAIDGIRKFTGVRELSVLYQVGGQVVLAGVLKIARVTKEGYDVILYSNNIAWAQQLKGKSLRNLTTLGQVAFLGSESFPASPYETVGAVTQPDIWVLDSDETLLTFRQVSYGNYPRNSSATGDSADRIDDLDWIDIPPSFFMVPLLKKVFQSIGWKLDGGFFNDGQVKKMFIPYVGDGEPRWNWGLLARANYGSTNQDYIGGTNEDWTINRADYWYLRGATQNWDYSHSWLITGSQNQYIVPVAGTYRFELDFPNVDLLKIMGPSGTPSPPFAEYMRNVFVVVRLPDDSDEYDNLVDDLQDYIADNTVTVITNQNVIAAYDFGTGYTAAPYSVGTVATSGTYTQTWNGIPYGTGGSEINGSGTINMSIGGVTLNRGDRVEAWLVTHRADNAYIVGTQITNVDYSFDVSHQGLPSTLDIASIVPDMDQLEFVQALIRYGNLHFEADPISKTIFFERESEYFRGIQQAIDLNDRGSIDQASIRPVPFAKESTLQWGVDDKDYLVGRFGPAIYSKVVRTDSIHYKTEKETVDVGLFAATMDRLYYYKYVSGAVIFDPLIIPTITDEKNYLASQEDTQWSYNYKPRLLISAGMMPGHWKYNGVELSEYPAARFSFDESGDYSLTFADDGQRVVRKGELLTEGNALLPVNTASGAYSEFWKKFYELRFNSHLASAVIFLRPDEFFRIKRSDTIRIGGGVYRQYAWPDTYDAANPIPVAVELVRLL